MYDRSPPPPIPPRRRVVYPMPNSSDLRFDRSIDIIKSKPPGGGGGSASPAPLELYQIDDTNVRVKSGTIASIVPDGVGVNIDVSGADGTWYFFFAISLNAAGEATAIELQSNTTGYPPSTWDTAYFKDGKVDVESGVIVDVRELLQFSQGLVVCGRDADDPETTPGTYQLQVGSTAYPT